MKHFPAFHVRPHNGGAEIPLVKNHSFTIITTIGDRLKYIFVWVWLAVEADYVERNRESRSPCVKFKSKVINALLFPPESSFHLLLAEIQA